MVRLMRHLVGIAAITFALCSAHSEPVSDGAQFSGSSPTNAVAKPATKAEPKAEPKAETPKALKAEPKAEPKAETPKAEAPNDEEAPKSDASAEGTGAEVENSWMGYVWILVIIYMFYAQEHVCEAYFVAAIDVFVADQKRKGSPLGEEAVAGATICALGCNGPELFTNLIACCILGGSDVGVGTIVGSEIFNLLVILGGAAISAPVLPILIDKITFTRDVFFYALSIILLAIVLKDGIVTVVEACGLFSCAIIYTTAVFFTSTIMKKAGVLPLASQTTDEEGKATGKMHGITVQVEEVIKNRMADSRNQEGPTTWHLDATPAGLVAEPVENEIARQKSYSQGRDAGAPASQRGSVGFQFEGDNGPVLPYKFLKEVVTKEQGIIELNFVMDMFSSTTLRVTVPDPDDNHKFLESIQKNCPGRVWVHDYNPFPSGTLKHCMHQLTSKENGIMAKLSELICLPVELALSSTLFFVDVKYVRYKSRWAGCFIGSMAWLAVFSYIMCSAADAIHHYFGIPTAVLGITLCAVGTSFPNAVASVLMSKQNKPALAIANALGSNVQNIFLAMALPWVIVTVFPIRLPGREPEWFSEFPMPSPGIMEGVAWMLGTLVFLLILILVGRCKLTRPGGYVLISLYILYVASAILECVGVNIYAPFQSLLK